MLQQHLNRLAETVSEVGLNISDFHVNLNENKTVTIITHNASGLAFKIYVSVNNFYDYQFEVETFRSHIKKFKQSFRGSFIFPFKFPVVLKSFKNWLKSDIQVFIDHKTQPDAWKPFNNIPNANSVFSTAEKQQIVFLLRKYQNEIKAKVDLAPEALEYLDQRFKILEEKLDQKTKFEWITFVRNTLGAISINLAFDHSQGVWLVQKFIETFEATKQIFASTASFLLGDGGY